jgi:hypothetical protein
MCLLYFSPRMYTCLTMPAVALAWRTPQVQRPVHDERDALKNQGPRFRGLGSLSKVGAHSALASSPACASPEGPMGSRFHSARFCLGVLVLRCIDDLLVE